MNTSKIYQLADFIEQHTELEFNQSQDNNPMCGSPGCIAGFAQAMENTNKSWWRYMDLMDFLDLNETIAQCIYEAGYCSTDNNGEFEIIYNTRALSDITREQAVRTLRHLAETGDVNWGFNNA